METEQEVLEQTEEQPPNTDVKQVLALMFADLRSRVKLPKLVLTLLLIGAFFSCGLFYAWVVDPVEWDYSEVPTPVPTLYNFTPNTQELVTLGLINIEFQTQQSPLSKSLVGAALAELAVNADTLCDIHYKYGAYQNETLYALQTHSVQCTP